jgi:twitching motility protein PilT
MTLESLVTLAAEKQASDIHLEVQLKPTLRIHGKLVASGEGVPRDSMVEMVRQVVGDRWDEFLARRSFDRAMTIAGIRCRVNALHSMRGPGLAIRLLPSVVPTLDGLNLHPDLRNLTTKRQGLVLVSGATGSGKSSTQAALLHEINANEARHILTIEEPIEYRLKPISSFVRQREVGSDTISFEQALLDAMREDPDVIMVGEMRDPECMRLTLNAAETGHLVLATLHSATVAEALQRIVLAFPSEIQSGIAAQLADALVAVVCQRLRFLPDAGLRVPECEILMASTAARSVIRQSEFSKLTSVLETGAGDGSTTFARYRRWVDGRSRWVRPMVPALDGSDVEEMAPEHRRIRTPAVATAQPTSPPMTRNTPRSAQSPRPAPLERNSSNAPAPNAAVFEIDPDSDDLNSVMAELVEKED